MSFSKEILNFVNKAQKRTEKVQKVAKIELFGSIIKDTPVLDGYLRGAWRVSYGGANLTVNNDKDLSGADTQSKMVLAVNSGKQGETTYFSNPLPYGPRIEYEGYSQKAPQGMVRKNIARLQGIIDTAIISTR